jgi:hypothetical protein
MRKRALIFSIFIIVISAVSALADESAPLSLRQMFEQSDMVVVGRIGAAGNWGALNDGSRSVVRSFPVVIEKVLKGSAPANLAVSEINFESAADTSLSRNTGRRLFFLTGYNNRYAGRLVELEADRSLALLDMEKYIARTAQLADLYKNGAPAKDRLLEFLVSMAEDPATRFDGASEIASSFVAQQQRDDAANHVHSLKAAIAEVAAHPEAYTEQELAAPYGDDAASDGDPDLAALLTAAQKDRLLKAFSNVEFDYDVQQMPGTIDEGYILPLTPGDAQLARAVAQFGNRAANARIMNELPSLARYDHANAAALLNIIAANSTSGRLKDLAKKFSLTADGYDFDKISDNSLAYDLADTLTDEQKAAQLAKLPAKTYSQRRSELLDKISMAVSELMAKNAVQ